MAIVPSQPGSTLIMPEGDKWKGSGCKGRNVKEEELLKFGDVARIVVKGLELEVQ